MTLPEDTREAFDRYVEQMWVEIQANAHKGHWRSLTSSDLMAEIYYHCAKLDYALRHQNPELGKRVPRDEIREFAADIGNMAMMLYDVEHCLHDKFICEECRGHT